jgi:hypothetical protein
MAQISRAMGVRKSAPRESPSASGAFGITSDCLASGGLGALGWAGPLFYSASCKGRAMAGTRKIVAILVADILRILPRIGGMSDT